MYVLDITLILVFGVSYILLTMYIKHLLNAMDNRIKNVENILDMEFIKSFIVFIYNDKLLNNMDLIIENLNDGKLDSVDSLFENIIPDAENAITSIYKFLGKKDDLTKKFVAVIENFQWVKYFFVWYGIVIISLYQIYYFYRFSRYMEIHGQFIFGMLYSFLAVFILSVIVFTTISSIRVHNINT
ncbi:hypothetical protein ACLIKE_08515, partial [Ferroplasma acidiphilum]